MRYFHPIVWQLLAGTVFARTASFMTMPFLVIYLQQDFHASALMIGLAVSIPQLTATFGGFFSGFFGPMLGGLLLTHAASALYFVMACVSSLSIICYLWTLRHTTHFLN